MEFDINLNKYFPSVITKLRGQDVTRLDSQLCKVLDLIGEASRVAQSLRRPVTAASQFAGSDQTLYIMIDPSANKGNGAIIGMLKTGPKKLFLIDRRGGQNELTPICVLDFYVHESRQRMGLGKQLFSHFLMDEKLRVEKIAIDRPSDKFLGFLRKHYGLEEFIPQVNNFVIYEGFFGNEETSTARNNKLPAAYPNISSFLPNRWNSMISMNTATDDSSLYRARGNQSMISCLYNEQHCNKPSADLWRVNSFASDPSQPNSLHMQTSNPLGASNSVSKFNHHRLW